jgi:hypothetical protein
MPARQLIWLAYLAAFLGVCGHASSEFFVKLSGLQGAGISVWRFMLGGAVLVLVCLLRSDSRDLLTPLREDPLPILALDHASAVQVATFVLFVLAELFYGEIRAALGRPSA